MNIQHCKQGLLRSHDVEATSLQDFKEYPIPASQTEELSIKDELRQDVIAELFVIIMEGKTTPKHVGLTFIRDLVKLFKKCSE